MKDKRASEDSFVLSSLLQGELSLKIQGRSYVFDLAGNTRTDKKSGKALELKPPPPAKK